MRLRGTSKRLVVALLLLGATASCAYYNTFYLARKYYFKATDGLPYEVDRENTTQRSNYSKSADYSKKLLGVYPRSKWVDDAWLLWAGTLIGTDDPLKAVAMLEEFQTRFPKSDLRPDATFFLGLAYRAARKHEKAVESFNEFLAQSPRHVLTPYAYYERSRAQLSLQRYSDAATSAGEILQRWPGHVLYDRALRQRAEARFQQHDWKGARADFHSIGERALTDDDRLRYLLREVDCLEASRDLDAARAQLRDARSHVELPPVVPEPPRVASSPLPGGAQPTPQPVYTQPTPAQERYGRITLRMGGVELLSGHAKEAVELYQTVLHDYPRSQLGAEAQFRIAFAYETGADDFTRARAEYGKVKEQAGTSQFSQQAQQRLDNLERIERFRTAGGADSAERKAESRFLVAEHYLFNLERPERAVEEYRAIAESSSAKAVKARALNAEAWVMSRKLDRKSAADSLFWTVVRGYPETEAQLAARDYLEGEGQSVPEDLIVPPKEFSKPVLELTEELPKPPAGMPPLGSRPALDPDASPLGPGLKPPPGVTPPITPPSWRPGSSPDSLRREIALRDSLLRAARRDTSTAGRARVDSLRRTFPHPDTAGRGALLAEIQRRQPKPVGVVIAPDSLAPPPFSAGDTSATRTPSRLGHPINAPTGPNPAATGAVVEARPASPARDTGAAGHSARTPDSTQRALPSRTPPAPAVPASPPKPGAPEGFSSVWVHFTKAQRDSIKHAKASYDSSVRAQKAMAKVAAKAKKQAKHSKTPADSTAKGAQ